jgi:hypothetical protein
MTSPATVAEYVGNISKFADNPAGMQRVAMATFDQIHDGKIEIVDATNPFVYAIETACVTASAMMQTAAALTRRQYPVSATTFEELYLHMSNSDYANIFALPTEAKFSMAIHKRQLIDHLVLDPDTGISKVTIPRNTVFFAADVPFSLQYPIDIRKLEHGELQIVYDVSQPTIFQNITTNVIDYEIVVNAVGDEFLRFDVETQQFDILSTTTKFDSTSGSFVSVVFPDQFYAARVFVSNQDGTWKELDVTYTDQVYNPLVPTAALQVVGNKLNVRLPLVYITSGLVSGTMRIDVMHTQGPMDLHLGNYEFSQFTADFRSIDKNDNTAYTSGFTQVTNVQPFSLDTTSGGRNALTFDELQSRVIQSSVGPRKLPITPSQIQAALLDKGYTLVKNIDTITNRIFWATKPLPAPNSSTLVTAANANVATIVTQAQQADSLQGCYSHTTGMTISPSALVQNTNGISALVTKDAFNLLMGLSLADRTSAINSGKYSYTPFHYVLDVTTDSFEVRPYYLDDPTVYSRSFIQENPDTGLQASVGSAYLFERTATGYRLTITTKSNDTFKALADNEVFCQLAFNSSSQASASYMLGEQQTRAHTTDERVFVFNIDTVFDINEGDALALPTFATNSIGFVPRADLKQTFSVIFGTTNAQAVQTPTTAIDSVLGMFQIPTAAIGITHEHLTLIFGYTLRTLWNSFRSFAASIPYKKHIADVPKYYDVDVFDRDPITGASFSVDNGGNIVYHYLHRAGDPVLDNQGHQIYLARAGDNVLDGLGRPVPEDNYQTIISRSVDLVTLDGVYQFANDPVTLEYVTQIRDSLLTSLTRDLVDLNEEALEKTEIFFYPAITQGNVNALMDNNQLVNIEAAQSLKVSLYVEEIVFNNKTLTAALQSATIKTIGNYLAGHTTVAVSQLEDALASVYGSDVISVSVTGLGGDRGAHVLTLTDDSTKLSIRKVLKLLPSSQLAVQEDISVVFTTHGFGSA